MRRISSRKQIDRLKGGQGKDEETRDKEYQVQMDTVLNVSILSILQNQKKIFTFSDNVNSLE